jgi:hypothetical protein
LRWFDVEVAASLALPGVRDAPLRNCHDASAFL